MKGFPASGQSRINIFATLVLYLILGLTPFLFLNRMTYNFHTPKYLFMQFSVFSLLWLCLCRTRFDLKANPIDALVLLRFLGLIPLAGFSVLYSGFFRNADIFFYLVLFYFLIQVVPDERDLAGIFVVLKNSAGLFTIICALWSRLL